MTATFLAFFALFPLLLEKDVLFAGRHIDNYVQIQDVSRGVFIVADPRIVDPNFSRTVILMLQHSEEGSSGLIINRPTDTPLSSLLPDAKSDLPSEKQLYTGGPVLRGTLTVVFRSNTPPDHLSPVFENVFASQEARVLVEQLKISGAENSFRLFTGYAGWAPGQLRAEMNRGDWRVVAADAKVIFEKESAAIWSEMFDRSQKLMVNLSASIFDS